MAGVKQEHGSCSGVEPPRVKEEPEETELGVKPEPEEVPVHAVPVKTEDHEDDKSSVLPRIPTVENKKEINPEDYSPEQPLTKVQRPTIELPPPKVLLLSKELLPPKGQRLTIQLPSPKRKLRPVSVAMDESKDPRPFRCAECCKGYKKREILQKHVKIHQRKKCPVCRQSFKTRHLLIQHLNLCRNDSQRPPGDAAEPSLPYMQFVWNVLHPAQ